MPASGLHPDGLPAPVTTDFILSLPTWLVLTFGYIVLPTPDSLRDG